MGGKNSVEFAAHKSEEKFEDLQERLADPIPIEIASIADENTGLEVSNSVNEMSDAIFNINCLPEEIFLKIFAHLDLQQLCRVGRVCKKWYKITRDPVFWKHVDVQLCFPRTPNIRLVNVLPSCVTYFKLEFKFWPFKVNFADFSAELKKRCPNLQTLILQHAQFTSTFFSFISAECLDNIRTLVLHISALSFASRKDMKNQDIVLSKIVILDISGCSDSIDFKLFPLDMPYLTMPCLKKLRLSNLWIRNSWFEAHPSLVSQLEFLDLGRTTICISRPFRMIREHGLHLVLLYLCHSDIRDEDFTFSESEKAFPNLQKICLSGCVKITSSAVTSLIRSCESLQRIYVGRELTLFLRSDSCDRNCSEIVCISDPCCHMEDLHYLHE